jgi:hypothetical protein
VAGVRVSAVNAVAINRHIGASGFGHDQQFVHGALETVEHLLCLESRRIDEQDFGAHLVDADHPVHSSVSRHGVLFDPVATH